MNIKMQYTKGGLEIESPEEINLIEQNLVEHKEMDESTKKVIEETKSIASRTMSIRVPEPILELLQKNAQEEGISMLELFNKMMKTYISGELTGEEKESYLEILRKNPIELEKFVLSEIEEKHLVPITNGSEGEIFKLKIEEKEYVVVKKRYANMHKNEFELLKKAKEIQEEINTNKNRLPINKNGNRIQIPAPIGAFVKNDSEYIMMEYIDGKTLYTMILEKLLEYEFINYLRKINDENKLKDYIYNIALLIPELDDDFIKNFFSYNSKDILKKICNKDGTIKNISFGNDSEAENQVLQFYSFLYENGYISENPTNQRGEHKENLFLVKKYKENIQKLSVFTEEIGIEITRELNYFIKEMHKAGLYHRDLGQNPRNIMFKKNGNSYDTYIIDFGKGIITSGENDSVYNDSFLGGNHDNDELITSTISMLSSSKETKLFKEEELDKISLLENLATQKYGLNKNIFSSFIKTLSLSQNKTSINHVKNIIDIHNIEKRKKTEQYLFLESIDGNLSRKGETTRNEIIKDSNEIKTRLLGYMAYMKNDDFEKLGNYLQNLDLSNMGKKAEGYKKFFLDLYNDIKEIR